MKRHKFMLNAWHIFAIATLALSLVFIGFMLYWTITPLRPIIEVSNNRIRVEPSTVRAGETTYLIYDYCKYGGAKTGKVVRYLKDELVYFLPTIDSNVQPGCQTYRIPLNIPANLPPDTYTYNSEITYEVNPIKTKTYYFTSDKFNVIGKDSK